MWCRDGHRGNPRYHVAIADCRLVTRSVPSVPQLARQARRQRAARRAGTRRLCRLDGQRWPRADRRAGLVADVAPDSQARSRDLREPRGIAMTIDDRASLTWFDESHVSAYISVPVETLRTWRKRAQGPRYHKFGRCVRYARADVDA